MQKSQKFQLKKMGGKVVAVAVSLLPVAAMATPAAIDVSEGVTKIEAAAVAGAAIGLAVLLLLIGIKVFKWVRGGM